MLRLRKLKPDMRMITIVFLLLLKVITAFGRVLKCYPKYIHNDNQPIKELAQVLQVIEKFNSKEQIIKIFNDSDESKSFNLLAVMLYLLHDYYENGSYENDLDIIETNDGEILWDKTINETFTFISNTVHTIWKCTLRKT